MEWVETTGRTLDEAKDAALDQLGVDTEDAEFEVLEEPRQGLFGRVRGEARVRARVRPTQPRPKVERRDRRRRGNSRSKDGERAPGNGAEAPSTTTTEPAEASEAPPTTPEPTPAPAGRGRGPRRDEQGAPTMTETDVDLDEHAAIIEEFLSGLVDAFGLEAEVATTTVDDDTAEVHVDGDDLGLLVGPKGATLTALQELSRTVVHRRVAGTAGGRVRIDVAGYRQRRREALERFTRGVAEEVRESGVQKALEPMNPADRKVVHDTVNEIDGVATISEGEEPRRRVVIVPEA